MLYRLYHVLRVSNTFSDQGSYNAISDRIPDVRAYNTHTGANQHPNNTSNLLRTYRVTNAGTFTWSNTSPISFTYGNAHEPSFARTNSRSHNLPNGQPISGTNPYPNINPHLRSIHVAHTSSYWLSICFTY